MTVQGRGKRAGIHLFVRSADMEEKFWLYVIYRSDSVVHQRAMDLREGELFRVETELTKADHAWVKTLEPVPSEK